ncbi:MAG: DUF5681 domain-containing protein [Planctomycetota bacterium]|jgi:hypothetical protein
MATDNPDDKKGAMVRNEKGHFVKGYSGNPLGRPKGTRNQITQLRENTELALRDYISSPENARKALKALDQLFSQAADGDIQALKLLLDKVLPNVRAGADDGGGEKQKPVAIQIVNQTSDKASNPMTIVDVKPLELEED